MSYQYFQRFDDLRWLIPLAVLHLLLFAQQWWWQRRQFDAALLKRFGPALSPWRLALKWTLWTAAMVCLVYALAVPLGPPIKVAGEQSGADIILVVDVSSSMHAQDIKPDRLEALKVALNGFVERVNGDRVGLVAFAGEAVIACPLTSDMETLSLFLSKLDTDSVPRDGTGLGPALKLALDGFEPDPKRGRLVMLATDGEDTSDSDTLAQAKRAAAAGIPVFTLGIGTPGGALIPGQRDLFGRVYAKTYQGQPVRTKLDSGTLKKIASITGAQYFEGASASGLAAAYDTVRSLKQGLAKSQDTYTREPLYQEPLLWAFWLLLIESLISAREWGWLKLWDKARARFGRPWQGSEPTLRLAFLLCLLPAGLAAAWDQGRAAYNQGNQAYRQGDFAAAAEAYQQSADAAPERPDAYYNLGNAKYQTEDYESAVSAYEQALALDPKDEDAKHNLDLARKKLEEQQKQGDKDGKGDKNGKKDGKGKDGKGEGKDGQGQGTKPGQGPGKPGQGQASSQRASAAQRSLNQDQVQAMMNQLRLDQKRYAGAFNPTKKFDQKQPSQQEQMEEMMRQQMGLPPKPKAEESQGGAERKDW